MAAIEKRINENGEASFRVRIRLRGRPAQSASFARLTDAKKWAQDTESAIRNGRYFKNAEAKKRTLVEVIDRYKREVLLRKKPSTQQNVSQHLRYWQGAFGAYLMCDISSAMVIEHRNKLLGQKNKYGREVGISTANRYVVSLGHLFAVAANQWEWAEENPVRKVLRFKEPRGRVRFLSDGERGKLLASCKLSDNPYLYAIVVLALSTGGRKMELLTLRWQDVNLAKGVITLHETKNGERRLMPLQGYARELIQSLHEKRNPECEYVFPSDTKCQPVDIRSAWVHALARAEIEDFRFHDLRHSAASYLAMNGATLAEIAEVLGHKTLQMVKRYAHLSEAHTAKVVASMNERIFGR